MIIGICGKSGSGKSTLARKIAETYDNTIHLDIDKIGHEVLALEEVKQELLKYYGADILIDNEIDRKKLGEIVFNSSTEMSKLSDLTWKYMETKIDKFITLNQDKIIILDWLLLSNTKYFNMCDIKILVDTPYQIRKERVTIRDNISQEYFHLREKTSINYDKNCFDYVFQNVDKLFNACKSKTTKVLYPGSFDPITKGHMNIIEQASNLFDEVIVAVLQNPNKNSGFFTLEERVEIIKDLYQKIDNIKVASGYTTSIDAALLNECKAIVRGLRNFNDYDLEAQLQQINKDISNNEINTVCLFADKEYQFISSSVVKELFYLGKDTSKYVDALVQEKMLVKKRNLKL